MSKESSDVKVINRYSEALKRKIAEEVSRGVLTCREAQKLYGISNYRTVTRWVQQYGENVQKTKVVRIMMKSEKERMEELEKALADEKIRNMVHSEQLKVYQEWVPDLKKRLNTKQLKEFEKNEQKIKNFR